MCYFQREGHWWSGTDSAGVHKCLERPIGKEGRPSESVWYRWCGEVLPNGIDFVCTVFSIFYMCILSSLFVLL